MLQTRSSEIDVEESSQALTSATRDQECKLTLTEKSRIQWRGKSFKEWSYTREVCANQVNAIENEQVNRARASLKCKRQYINTSYTINTSLFWFCSQKFEREIASDDTTSFLSHNFNFCKEDLEQKGQQQTEQKVSRHEVTFNLKGKSFRYILSLLNSRKKKKLQIIRRIIEE